MVTFFCCWYRLEWSKAKAPNMSRLFFLKLKERLSELDQEWAARTTPCIEPLNPSPCFLIVRTNNTDFTSAPYFAPGLLITSTLAISFDDILYNSLLSVSFLPFTYIMGVPLPKTVNLSSSRLTPGSCPITSIAFPSRLKTDPFTVVIMPPFVKCWEGRAFTVTSSSRILSETSTSVPISFFSSSVFIIVLYPRAEICRNFAFE